MQFLPLNLIVVIREFKVNMEEMTSSQPSREENALNLPKHHWTGRETMLSSFSVCLFGDQNEVCKPCLHLGVLRISYGIY